MLLSLHIKNYALIEDLHLEFTPGLNIFTGETGAGKSIIIESLGLILGERASSQMIKKGSQRCFITAEFDCVKLKNLCRYLDDSGLGCSKDESLILRREIDVNGKSRAFVNDNPVSINTLFDIGEYLVDVHGQHEHQTLIKTSSQRDLLDRFAGNDELLGKINVKYHAWKQLLSQKDSQKLSEDEKQRLIDLYSFQIKEIDDARLQAGEEEEIESILPQLKNSEKLKEMSDEIDRLLNSDEGAVLERLSKAQRLIENINSICGSLVETSSNLQAAYYQIEESAKEIESFAGGLEADPEKLNSLLGRQDLIYKLKKKYGQTINEILQYREKTNDEFLAISKSEENKQELEKKIKKEESALVSLCEQLSASRKKAADKLSSQVKKELLELGMKKLQFKVSVEREAEITSHGSDKIEFLFSANPGEDLKPLKNIASGGEMSRVMLALKTILTKADSVPTLVFDEIDNGIGGPMGQVVGKKLLNLSRSHQALCITHLPQIAAFASQHLSVSKQDKNGATSTQVKVLSDKEHIEEVARMLSGETITPSARKHASELVKQSV